MADTFAPKLSSNVQFIQPVENRGTATMLEGLSSALSAWSRNQTTASPGPLGSAGNPDPALASYTQEMTRLTDTRETIGEDAYRVGVKKLNTKFAGMGVDVTGASFKSVRENLTGMKEENLVYSSEEIVFNKLVETPEGQARIALASAELTKANDGKAPTRDETMNYIVARDAEKVAFDQLKIRNELEYQNAAPQIQAEVTAMGNAFAASIDIIEASGLRIDDPEMLQNSYLEYQAERSRIVSKIPMNIPNRDQEIKNLFEVTDTFFENFGISSGDFKRLPKDQLDLKRKAVIAVEMLNKRGDAASSLLAMGILNSGYKLTPEIMDTVSSTLGENVLVSPTPEWITDAGIVVSNDMITLAQDLTTAGAQTLRTVSEQEEAMTNLVGADVAEKWAGLTAEAAWKDMEATSKLYKGFSRDAILNGEVNTDIPYQMAFKLSMGLKSIDFENEAVTFSGLRSTVDANLPVVLDALDAKDPAKGKAARTLLYVATGKAARQYDAQIAAEEQRFGMSFDPTRKVYSLDYSTIADSTVQQIVSRVVEEQYGGDIIKASEDGFSRAVNIYPGRTGAALKGRMIDTLPDKADMRRLLDLRSSSVYLATLSSRIEPKEFKDAREQDAAVAAGGAGGGSGSVGSVTATLLDKFEGGGSYDTLFGFANKAGGPFADVKVSEMTIGQLKDFSNGAYADYSRQQLGYKATPMGRFQFVGTTLASVANKMGLDDNTVFTPEVQNKMFMFHAKEVLAGKSAAGKRSALRQTWEGLKNASDAELNQMVAEIEGGKASFETTGAGTGGAFTGATPASANAVASASGAATQRAVENAPSAAPMVAPTVDAGAAPATPVEAIAAMPEQIAPTTTGDTTGSAPAPAANAEVQAAIQEMINKPDATYASDAEFLAAQEKGDLSPGDSVVVDGTLYIIRKDGTAKRIGNVAQ